MGRWVSDKGVWVTGSSWPESKQGKQHLLRKDSSLPKASLLIDFISKSAEHSVIDLKLDI